MEIAIIGGGLIGLTLADHLSAKGHTVSLFESNDQLGGQCSSVELNSIIVDRFYHAFFTDDFYIVNLIEKLGLKNRIKEKHISYGILKKNQIFPLNNGFDFLKYKPISLFNRFRLIWTLLNGLLTKNWDKQNLISAKEWLIKKGGYTAFSSFWEPMLKKKVIEASETLSSVGICNKLTRAVGETTKQKKENKIGYIQGTLKTLIDAYEKYLIDNGVTIYKNINISNINITSTDNIILNNFQNSFSKAVFTIPTPSFIKIIPESYSAYKTGLASLEYIGNYCIILMLKKSFIPFYMVGIGDYECPLTSIIDITKLYDEGEFKGHSICYLSQYFYQYDPYVNNEPSQIYSKITSNLKKHFNLLEDDIIAYTVTKVRYTEPIYNIGYKPPAIKTPINNVFLVNGSQCFPKPTVMNTSIELATKSIDYIL